MVVSIDGSMLLCGSADGVCLCQYDIDMMGVFDMMVSVDDDAEWSLCV